MRNDNTRNFYIVLSLLLLFAVSAKYSEAGDWSTCSSIGFCGTNPSLPIFGEGSVINLRSGVTARDNAAYHIVLATAIPLVGLALGGNKGKWIAGLSWIALTLIQESVFHTPNSPSASYPSEVRTDLISRIVPTLLVLQF